MAEVVLGLKRLRSAQGKKPEYHCDNCGKDRYSKCGCKKSLKPEKAKKD